MNSYRMQYNEKNDYQGLATIHILSTTNRCPNNECIRFCVIINSFSFSKQTAEDILMNHV